MLIALEYQILYQMNAKTLYYFKIFRYAKDLNLMFININENMTNQTKLAKKLRGIPTNLLISQMLIALEYQTCFQMYAN